MPVQPIPDGYRSVTPYLIVSGAAAAIDFYKAAFGAVESAVRVKRVVPETASTVTRTVTVPVLARTPKAINSTGEANASVRFCGGGTMGQGRGWGEHCAQP